MQGYKLENILIINTRQQYRFDWCIVSSEFDAAGYKHMIPAAAYCSVVSVYDRMV